MEYQQEVVFVDLNTEPLEKAYIKRIKMMKMGTTTKLCAICIDNFKKGCVIYKLPCNHIFHTHC